MCDNACNLLIFAFDLFQHSEHFIYNTNPNKRCGHKWSLKSLWRFLKEEGCLPPQDIADIWTRIKDLVVMSILGGLTDMKKDSAKTCSSGYNSYKLLGEINIC